MYVKCNSFWLLLASFPISLYFVRLIPQEVWDRRRDQSVTEKAHLYMYQKFLHFIYHVYSNRDIYTKVSIYDPDSNDDLPILSKTNFFLFSALQIYGILYPKWAIISNLGDWSQPV